MFPVASSLPVFTSVFLLLSPFGPSLCQHDLVVVKLANGRTSRPLRLLPLHGGDEHFDLPTASPQVGHEHDDVEVSHGLQELREADLPKQTTVGKAEKRSLEGENEELDGNGTSLSSTSDINQFTSKPTTTATSTSPSTTTTTSKWTTSASPSKPPQVSVTVPPSSTTSLPSTERSPSPSQCHQECREALNATSLQPHTSLTLKQGSMLKLMCQVPLVTPLVVENLAWLYQSDEISKRQCALNKQDFIAQCQGFHNITEIYDKNDTLIKDTIIVGNLQGNYSGQYMCQVQITCCPGSSEEHVMNHELSTRVTVWLTDYTVDLAITGSLAVGLVLLLIAGSIYLARQNHGDYVAITDKTLDIKPMTVLHIPLVDDQDNDSFDSNFDEQD